ncbi:unnamed protein product [Lactuca saligna]|uniref:Uncharacterized protein n=1 Tax=Lactuca saligna TaxID=75948 RepID=A0AA35Z2V5_LACSI|nr:unnamed protein product [Lactuca saligna]
MNPFEGGDNPSDAAWSLCALLFYFASVTYMFVESLEGDGSWSVASSSKEERVILDDSDPINTPEIEDTDEEPNYTLAKHPLETSLSPDYTSAGLELISSEYEPNEDREDIATSPEASPT